MPRTMRRAMRRAAVASRVTVLHDKQLYAEDFTALAHRSSAPQFTTQHTPVTCGLELQSVRTRLLGDPHELFSSQLAFTFNCECAGGHVLRGGVCAGV